MSESHKDLGEGARNTDEAINTGIFSQVYCRLRETSHAPACDIRYFPYQNIKNTLRIRDQKYYIRISDMLKGAPDPVMASIYEILLCKTFRISSYHRANLVYNRYLASSELPALNSISISFSRNSTPPDHRNKSSELERRFKHLKQRYFQGQIENLEIYWINRKSRRILGQYVPHRKEILINRILDHPLVPKSVIDFVLYHEMLHSVIQPRISKTGRKMVHHGEFKRKEKQFEGYLFADEFIRENF